jgi:hypothetical protein
MHRLSQDASLPTGGRMRAVCAALAVALLYGATALRAAAQDIWVISPGDDEVVEGQKSIRIGYTAEAEGTSITVSVESPDGDRQLVNLFREELPAGATDHIVAWDTRLAVEGRSSILISDDQSAEQLADPVTVYVDNLDPVVTDAPAEVVVHVRDGAPEFTDDVDEFVLGAEGAESTTWSVAAGAYATFADVSVDSSGLVTVRAIQAGTAPFTVEVVDTDIARLGGRHTTGSAVVNLVVNTPPRIALTEVDEFIAFAIGDTFPVDLSSWAVDGDGDALEWEVVERPPAPIVQSISGDRLLLGATAPTASPVSMSIWAKDRHDVFTAPVSLQVFAHRAAGDSPVLYLLQPLDGAVVRVPAIEFRWIAVPADGVGLTDADTVDIQRNRSGATASVLTDPIPADAGGVTLQRLRGVELRDEDYTLEVQWANGDNTPKSVTVTVDAVPPDLDPPATPVEISLESPEETVELAKEFGAGSGTTWAVQQVSGFGVVSIKADTDPSAGLLDLVGTDAPEEDGEPPWRHVGEATFEVVASDHPEGTPSDPVILTVITEDLFPALDTDGPAWEDLRSKLNYQSAEDVYLLTAGTNPTVVGIDQIFVDREDGLDLRYSWETSSVSGIEVLYNNNARASTEAPIIVAEGATVDSEAELPALLTLTATDSRGGSVSLDLPVRINNRPTVVASSEELVVTFPERGTESRDLATFIDDADVVSGGDALDWGIAAAGEDDGILVVLSPVATPTGVRFSREEPGSARATFDLTATDLAGSAATATITVIVDDVPDPPEGPSTISGTVTSGRSATTIQVDDHFTDHDDNDDVMWELDPDGTLSPGVSATVSRGKALEVLHEDVEGARDRFTLALIVDDTQPETDPVSVAVTFDVNHPPKAAEDALEPVTLDEGGDGWDPIDLAALISDDDGDALTFTLLEVAASPPFTDPPFDASVDDATLTLTLVPDGEDLFGDATIELEVDDDRGGVTQFMLPVAVADVNDSPQIVLPVDPPDPERAIPTNRRIEVGVGSERTFDLSDHAVDGDLEDGIPFNDVGLEWTATITPPGSPVTETIAGSTLTIQVPADVEAETGTSLALTVSDGELSDTLIVLIKVDIIATVALPDALPVPTNGAPPPIHWDDSETKTPWPSELVEDAATTYSLDLRPYVDNRDEAGDTIDRWDWGPRPAGDPPYAPSDEYPVVVVDEISSGEAILAFLEDWHGTHAITITITDGGVPASGEIAITVQSELEAPRWLVTAPRSREFAEHHWGDTRSPASTVPIPIAELVEDDDDDLADLQWEFDIAEDGSPLVGILSAREERGSLVIGPLGTPGDDPNESLDWHGVATVKVTVTDTEGNSSEHTIDVTVTPTAESLRWLPGSGAPLVFPTGVDRFAEHSLLARVVDPDRDVSEGNQEFGWVVVETSPANVKAEFLEPGVVRLSSEEDWTDEGSIQVRVSKELGAIDPPPGPGGPTLAQVRRALDGPDINITANPVVDPADPGRWTVDSAAGSIEIVGARVAFFVVSDPPIPVQGRDENELPEVSDITVSEPADIYGTRTITFLLKDEDLGQRESAVTPTVTASYQVATPAVVVLDDDGNVPAGDPQPPTLGDPIDCALRGASTPGVVLLDDLTTADRSTAREAGLTVRVAWHAATGALANTVTDIVLQIVVTDDGGVASVPEQVDANLDNTNRVTPEIVKARLLGDGSPSVEAGEIPVEIEFRQALIGPTVNLRVAISEIAPGAVYRPAILRLPGDPVETQGVLYTAQLETPSPAATAIGTEDAQAESSPSPARYAAGTTATSFLWNVVANGITGTGAVSVGMRVTPVAADNVAAGPTARLSLVVEVPKLPETRLVVRVVPPSRIITPGMVGYNDTLTVLFRPTKPDVQRPVTHTGRGPLQSLTIYTISGREVQSIGGVGKPAVKVGNDWYRYAWDGKSPGGGELPAGLYMFVLQHENELFKGTVAIAR